MKTTHTKLIGLTGAKGAGKDTVADHLEYMYNFKTMAFALPIKAALSAMHGVPISMFMDPLKKEVPQPKLLGRTPRFLMETMGTGWGRDMVDKDYWVNLLSLNARECLAANVSVVVSDVRYDNEAQLVKDLGGEVWHIARGETIYTPSDHSSEAGVSDQYIDFRIINDSTLRMLYTQIGVGLAKIARKRTGPNHNPTF